MAARKKYDVLSPDGFSIDPSKTYTSKVKARAAFEEWKKRYEHQGYYSSPKYGRIPLEDLAEYMSLVQV